MSFASAKTRQAQVINSSAGGYSAAPPATRTVSSMASAKPATITSQARPATVTAQPAAYSSMTSAKPATVTTMSAASPYKVSGVSAAAPVISTTTLGTTTLGATALTSTRAVAAPVAVGSAMAPTTQVVGSTMMQAKIISGGISEIVAPAVTEIDKVNAIGQVVERDVYTSAPAVVTPAAVTVMPTPAAVTVMPSAAPVVAAAAPVVVGGATAAPMTTTAGRIFTSAEAKGGCEFNPGKTACLFIEYQNEFTTPGGKLFDAVKDVMDATGMLQKSVDVATMARASGAKVFHAPISFAEDASDNPNKGLGILAGCANDKLFTAGTWNSQICDAMAPQPGDIVVTGKKGLDAFPGTDLSQKLLDNGIETIALGGFLTNCCVESTMRTACEHGFHVITLTDCTATTSMEGQKGATEGTYGMFSQPMSAGEFMTKLKGSAWMTGGCKVPLSEDAMMLLKQNGWDQGVVGFGSGVSEATVKVTSALALLQIPHTWVELTFDKAPLADGKMGVGSLEWNILSGGHGAMPALCVDGTMLVESVQIVKFLAEQTNQPQEVHDVIDFVAMNDSRMLEAAKHWGWCKLHESNDYAMVTKEHYTAYGFGNKDEAWEQDTALAVRNFLDQQEAMLAAKGSLNGYFIGDQMTLADCVLINWPLTLGGVAGVDMSMYPNIMANYEIISQMKPPGTEMHLEQFPGYVGYVGQVNQENRDAGFTINKYYV